MFSRGHHREIVQAVRQIYYNGKMKVKVISDFLAVFGSVMAFISISQSKT